MDGMHALAMRQATWGILLEELSKFAVTLRTTTAKLAVPSGGVQQGRYLFRRLSDGRVRTFPLPSDFGPGLRVGADRLEAICRTLDIDPADLKFPIVF